MSTKSRQMFSMQCDFTGCPAELESDDGGAWLYDTAEEARKAAYDYDWVTDGDRDYCDRHRDEVDNPVTEPSELLEAVDELTLPRNVKIPTDDGHAWATEDALLVQLQEAVSSSIRSGSGAGGAAWTRNVLDSDALYQASIITATIGDWCHMAGIKPTRDPVKDLRAWYAARLTATNPDEFYIGQLRRWAGQIRAMTSPPKTLEITAPCPVCGEGQYTNDLGEVVRNPLQMTYRADANMWHTAKVLCRACEVVWVGGEAMAELRDELDEKETA